MEALLKTLFGTVQNQPSCRCLGRQNRAFTLVQIFHPRFRLLKAQRGITTSVICMAIDMKDFLAGARERPINAHFVSQSRSGREK